MTYTVKRGLEYHGKFFAPDSTIEIDNESTAAWLLDCGAIEPLDVAVKPTKKGGK